MGCLAFSGTHQKRYIKQPQLAKPAHLGMAPNMQSTVNALEVADSVNLDSTGGPATFVKAREKRFCFCCCRRRRSKRPSAAPADAQFAVIEELPHFTVKVEHPETGEVLEFYARTDEPELTLGHVMNWITFDADQGFLFDASFMSRYNAAKDDIDYYVYRLLSIEVTDEEEPSRGPIWHVYINN